jgi:hypothetical protein
MIRISGWRIGARTISAVSELRASTALGHLGAKNVIYDIIGGVSVDVAPLHGIDPDDLASRLTACGFVASVHRPGEEGAGHFVPVELASSQPVVS